MTMLLFPLQIHSLSVCLFLLFKRDVDEHSTPSHERTQHTLYSKHAVFIRKHRYAVAVAYSMPQVPRCASP